jgi:DNA mismatch endonuclease (patch repair protein)
MKCVRGKNTSPELLVRKLLHRLGYRFRLHCRGLPGTPDIVFPSRNKVIFVHGCFWHRHAGCKKASMPKKNAEFWSAKFTANVCRDKRKSLELQGVGYEVLVVWECETDNPERLSSKLRKFLVI